MTDGTRAGPEFSPQQRLALRKIGAWWRDPDRAQVFRLFGFAGTGKTTIASTAARLTGAEVAFAAFTGKAAAVLRSKGCEPASTIHGLIYQPAEKSRAELIGARRELALCLDPQRRAELEALIERLETDLASPSFVLNRFGLAGIDLLILDEVSMIGDQMGRDLLSFEKPLLVLGDPAQLPPVGGDQPEGFFMRDTPDVLLTEIHRQQADSPVLDLATRVRDGRGVRPADVFRGELPILSAASDHGQVLVGRNVTRWDINTRVRRALGRQAGRPEPGDRIVCLANNGHLGLFNGQVFTVHGIRPAVDTRDPMVVELRLVEIGEDEDTAEWIPADLSGFIDLEFERTAQRQAFKWKTKGLFTWAYALTTHKAQGSQWAHVFVVDESYVFRTDAARWLYTSVTRASESVILGSADNFT